MNTEPPPAPTPLTWTVHRAKETPVKTALVSVLLLCVVALGFWYAGPLLAAVAIVVFFASLHTYFLPVTCTLDDSGVTVDKRLFRHTYEWKTFRRWFRTTGGIVLSPFSRRTFLDNFRGVHLFLPRDPGRVIEYLERRFAPPPADDRLKLD